MILDVDLRYPVILGPDRRIMDGMHRIARGDRTRGEGQGGAFT